jgi:hypothetical protein
MQNEPTIEFEVKAVRCLGTSSLNGQLVFECDGNIVTAISEEEAVERFETIEVLHSLELACVIPSDWGAE